MPGSSTITQVGQALSTLAITTSEDTYTFNYPTAAQQGTKTAVQLIANVDWLYSHKSGGPFFPVGATIPFDLTNLKGARVIYVKAATTNGTLYGIVKDGPIPSARADS